MLDQIRTPSDIPFAVDPDNDPCLIDGSPMKTAKMFKEEFDRRLKEKRISCFSSQDDWWESYCEICDYFGVQEMDRQRAMNVHHANNHIKPSSVKPPSQQPKLVHREGKSRSEVVDITSPQSTSEEEYEDAITRKEATGMSLYQPALTPEAWAILKEIGSINAIDLYYRLSGNVNLFTGGTRKKSRKEWAEDAGISRSTWARTEKAFIEKGLIEYHPEDVAHAWEQPVSFILPHIPEWRNVKRVIDIYEKDQGNGRHSQANNRCHT